MSTIAHGKNRQEINDNFDILIVCQLGNSVSGVIHKWLKKTVERKPVEIQLNERNIAK